MRLSYFVSKNSKSFDLGRKASDQWCFYKVLTAMVTDFSLRSAI
jgi:hypothetical protein